MFAENAAPNNFSIPAFCGFVTLCDNKSSAVWCIQTFLDSVNVRLYHGWWINGKECLGLLMRGCVWATDEPRVVSPSCLNKDRKESNFPAFRKYNKTKSILYQHGVVFCPLPSVSVLSVECSVFNVNMSQSLLLNSPQLFNMFSSS